MLNKALGLLPGASQHAPEVDFMLECLHWFMLALFVGWSIYFFYVLLRFRQSRNTKADYHGVRSHASSYIEVIVVIIEAALLLVFAFPLWAKRVNQFPSGDKALVVKVVAEQFAWNIHYSGNDRKFGKADLKFVSGDNPVGLDRSDVLNKDDVLERGRMTLPVNKPVIVHLTSKDVIHSFCLRHMRITQDNTPGLDIPIWFVPTKTSKKMREEESRMIKTADGFVYPKNPSYLAMQDYSDANGKPIVKAMDNVTVEILKKLSDAGIDEIRVGPAMPFEITCAQLCGMGHFGMKGDLIILEQDEFDKWLNEKSTAAASSSGSSYD